MADPKSDQGDFESNDAEEPEAEKPAAGGITKMDAVC